jgi:hypothetical protein
MSTPGWSPIGDGTISAVVPDALAAVRAAPIRAIAEQATGRTTFVPDATALPPQLVDAHGQFDLYGYVGLLAAAVQAQATQIEALTKLVVSLEPRVPTPIGAPALDPSAPPSGSAP